MYFGPLAVGAGAGFGQFGIGRPRIPPLSRVPLFRLVFISARALVNLNHFPFFGDHHSSLNRGQLFQNGDFRRSGKKLPGPGRQSLEMRGGGMKGQGFLIPVALHDHEGVGFGGGNIQGIIPGPFLFRHLDHQLLEGLDGGVQFFFLDRNLGQNSYHRLFSFYEAMNLIGRPAISAERDFRQV